MFDFARDQLISLGRYLPFDGDRDGLVAGWSKLREKHRAAPVYEASAAGCHRAPSWLDHSAQPSPKKPTPIMIPPTRRTIS
jgi:hypothetical protein